MGTNIFRLIDDDIYWFIFNLIFCFKICRYMIKLFILALLFGITGAHDEISVDLIELNHVRRDNCDFDQIIFWKEYPAKGLNLSEFRAIGFHVIGNYEQLTPIITQKNGFYKVRHKFQDRCGEKPITVISKLYRESWSMDDPERESVRKHWHGECPNFFKYSELNNNE